MNKNAGGLLAAGLLTGPMGAQATVIYEFAYPAVVELTYISRDFIDTDLSLSIPADDVTWLARTYFVNDFLVLTVTAIIPESKTLALLGPGPARSRADETQSGVELRIALHPYTRAAGRVLEHS